MKTSGFMMQMSETINPAPKIQTCSIKKIALYERQMTHCNTLVTLCNKMQEQLQMSWLSTSTSVKLCTLATWHPLLKVLGPFLFLYVLVLWFESLFCLVFYSIGFDFHIQHDSKAIVFLNVMKCSWKQVIVAFCVDTLSHLHTGILSVIVPTVHEKHSSLF